jgi:hypothetical protein
MLTYYGSSRGSLTTSPRALLHKIELLSPDSKIDQVPKTIASIPLASAILPNTLTINEKTFAFATDNSSVTTFNYVTKEEVTFATSPEVSVCTVFPFFRIVAHSPRFRPTLILYKR